MAVTTIPTAGIADDAVTTAKTSYSTSPFRNIIINGDMSIAQRGTSTSGITGNGYHTIDRFQTINTSLGTWTQSQSTDVPTGQGFAKSLKMDCTTADASPASSDLLQLRTAFEGQNLQKLKFGTSSAESLTLSFWVKSNKTGTYTMVFFHRDATKQFSKSYTISSANTWEKKTITVVGNTDNGIDNDNAKSFDIWFNLGAGSNFTSGSLSSSWEAETEANYAVGQVNLADSTDNEWYITGVQLEVGEFDSNTIPSFPFESFENNLRKCQRYLQKFTCADSTYNVFGTGVKTGSTSVEIPVPLKTTMRAKPSLSSSGLRYRDATAIDSSITIGGTYTDRDFPMLQLSNSTAADSAGFLQGASSSDFLQFDSEL